MNPVSLTQKKKKVLPAFFYVDSYSKCKHPKGSYYLNREKKIKINKNLGT